MCTTSEIALGSRTKFGLRDVCNIASVESIVPLEFFTRDGFKKCYSEINK